MPHIVSFPVTPAHRVPRLWERLLPGGFRLLILLLLGCLIIGRAAADSLPEVISAGDDKTIKRWDANGKLAATLGTHDSSIRALALLPGSEPRAFASLDEEGVLKIWERSETSAQYTVTAHKGGFALAVSPDGRLIATGGKDKMIRLWTRSTGKKAGEIEAHGDAVRSLRFTSDGALLVSASADRLIRKWKIKADGKNWALDYDANIAAHEETITGLALTSDNKLLASVSNDEYLKIWRLDGGVQVHRIKVGGKAVNCVAFSPDGSLVATGDEEGKVRIWNVQSGAATSFTGSHEKPVYALAFSKNGKVLVSGGADRTLRYWSVPDGKELAKIAAHDDTIRTLAILSD